MIVLLFVLVNTVFAFKKQQTSVITVSPLEKAIALPIPSLDEMAGDWMPMKNVANPPAVHNFHDMLIIGYDLTSFSCSPGYFLWHTKPDKIYPPIRLLFGGKEFPAEECRWYPYRALRRNLNCAGFVVETDIRMINEQNAVLCRIHISNTSTLRNKSIVSLEVPGQLKENGLNALTPFQKSANDTKYSTTTAPCQKPFKTVAENGMVCWSWEIDLSPGEEKILEFVSGHGEVKEEEQVVSRVMNWCHEFGSEFDRFKQCWEQRWKDAFTPGNDHFSGNLPVLSTDNLALKRNYYMGVVTMLTLERTQFSIYPRSFVTSGERRPGTQYFWDASMQATVWALLEPSGMKATMRRWLVQNVRKGVVIMLDNTKGFDKERCDSITGYAFSACTIFQTVFNYLTVTHDMAFLDEKLENGKTVLSRMDEISTDWKGLTLPDSPLANYGENRNLLECAPDYIHRVPSANAQNILMMREAALLYELHNNFIRAKELRGEADRFLPAVLSLYKPGDGVWYGLHKDGKRVELRHCLDYIYIGNALVDDLTPTMRKEMSNFVKRELLMRDWMRAMSQKDAAASRSDRPDHGPMGAFDGWIPLTVGTMWRLGFPQDAFEFYCRTAVVTKEGPFAQAREFYGSNRTAYNAPVRVAYRMGCLKECISGAAFSDVVINTFFGFRPSFNGNSIVVDPLSSRPFNGTLSGLRYNDKLFKLTAGNRGVTISKYLP